MCELHELVGWSRGQMTNPVYTEAEVKKYYTGMQSKSVNCNYGQ